jgi:chromosome segregation ATPase
MPDQLNLDFNVGLSDEEKRDLERMIGEFQEMRSHKDPANDINVLLQQIDTLNQRLAYLGNMLLNLDRRIQPLYETIRLTYQKSEILNQRIDTLIESIRTGEPL